MVRQVRPAHSKPDTYIGHNKAGGMMRRMSANNHWGQEGENFHKQAGYMRAMIFSHINDQIVLQTEWVHICIYSVSPSTIPGCVSACRSKK